MNSLLKLSLGLLVFLSSFTILAQEKATTVYLIRHAEKLKTDPTEKNPHLNTQGLKRSHVWAEFFKNIPIDHIFSTAYHRTQETVAVLAKSKKINVQTYAPTNKAVDSIVKSHPGDKMLFVGHSNTIPSHTNQLIKKQKFADMSEKDNHSLFIIQLTKDSSNVVRIFVD